MDIRELKKAIEERTINDEFMVFIMSDDSSKIIADQYVDKIASLKNLTVKGIDSLNDIPDDSFIQDDNLYVINTDEWSSDKEHINTIVVCNKAKDGIKFPPLSDWQIIDRALYIAKGMSKQDLEELLIKYSSNYRRFLNDVEKIGVFNVASQKIMYEEMIRDGQFDTLTNLTIWDLKDAIMNRDSKKVGEILKYRDYIDIEPLGLVTVLYKAFKSILMIKTNPKCAFKEVGLKSEKQLWFYRKNLCNYYSEKEILKILKLLTNVEYLFKYGGIEMNNLIDYIIINVMGVN